MFTMQTREIERDPKVPALSSKAIALLTKLMFKPDDLLEKADLIFAFASTTQIEKFAHTIQSLVIKGIANTVYIAGGKPKFTDSANIPKAESEITLELIKPEQFPNVHFYLGKESTSTLENVTEALKILDFTQFKKVVYVFKKHDCLRAYLTLKKYLPHTTFIQHTFEPTYPNTDRPLTKDTWYTYDFGRSRVWGEYLRIKLYGERGDIYYDESVKALVDEINSLVNQ